MSSRADEKKRLREEREARAQKDASSAANRKRLGALAGVVAAAAVVVIALILLNGGDSDKKGASSGGNAAVAGATEVKSLLAGIPQKGERLGNPKAPVTLTQYVDLQCPFCAEYSTKVLPDLVRDYVRDGKVQLQQRTVTIIGDDSQLAAQWAAAAGQRNKLYDFSETFFRNQGRENTGYITSSFLNKIAKGSGANAAATSKASNSTAASDQVAQSVQAFQTLGFDSTPSFTLGRTGQTPSPLKVSQLATSEFTGPIDKLLKSSKG